MDLLEQLTNFGRFTRGGRGGRTELGTQHDDDGNLQALARLAQEDGAPILSERELKTLRTNNMKNGRTIAAAQRRCDKNEDQVGDLKAAWNSTVAETHLEQAPGWKRQKHVDTRCQHALSITRCIGNSIFEI